MQKPVAVTGRQLIADSFWGSISKCRCIGDLEQGARRMFAPEIALGIKGAAGKEMNQDIAESWVSRRVWISKLLLDVLRDGARLLRPPMED